MAQNNYYQYEPFQIALEMNLENFIFRNVARRGFESSISADQRAITAQHIAIVRKNIRKTEWTNAKQKFHQIQIETPTRILNKNNLADINISLNDSLSEIEKLPRISEVQLMKALTQKNLAYLERFVDILTSHTETSWTDIQIAIATGVLLSAKNKIDEARNSFQMAYDLCQKMGLERLAAICLGYLVFTDRHYEILWLQFLNSLPAGEKELLGEKLRSLLETDITSTDWIVGTQNRNTSTVENSEDLIVDKRQGKVFYKGAELSLNSQSILFKLLHQMAMAKESGLSKELIISQVWGFDYDPLTHDPMIYTNIRRLREYIPVELSMGNYRLPQKLKWKCVEANKEISMLSKRQRTILNLVQSSLGKKVNRREVAHSLRLSARTALRELNELVQKRILIQVGAGRGSRYILVKGA